MKRIRRYALFVIVAALLGSCSSSESATTTTAAPATTASVSAPTASGGQIDFGSLEGTDTVLWFWAPW